MLRLLTFGGLGLESDDGVGAPRLRPPRLALLAILAAAGDRGVSRDRLIGLLWPETDEQHASHSLRQARYAMRNELGREVIRAEGSILSLDSAMMCSDVAEFHAAMAKCDRHRAVELARGPFLDGFYLPAAPAFERWVEEERAKLSSLLTDALLSLATEASAAGRLDAAAEQWRRLTVREPLSGRFAIGYLKALQASGHRAEALSFARQHEALVRRELETDPDPEIRRLEAELRAMPTPSASRATIAAANPRGAGARDAPALAEPWGAAANQPVSGSPEVSRARKLRGVIPALTAVGLLMTVTAALARQNGWFSRDTRPVLAVGLIREDGLPDSARIGAVLTDMLATNLARIEGLNVLANSRLLELMRPGRDSSSSFTDAARRAGASEILEGRLAMQAHGPLELEMRRVELRTGIVRDVYRARAANRYALIDSVTHVVAGRFMLPTPSGSIASATTGSPVAYRLYEEGLRALFQGEPRNALRLMHAALEEDSTFAMAAYYEVDIAAKLAEQRLPNGESVVDAQRTVLRLAQRAPDRERLTITANLLLYLEQPDAVVIAESLATKFPNDPRTFETLGTARWTVGDWPGAVAALERAIALDSTAEVIGTAVCHLCVDYGALGDVYMWWDSLPAAARVARRYVASKPGVEHPWYWLAFIAARRGDSAAAYEAYRRNVAMSGGDRGHAKLRLDLTLGQYGDVERDVRPLLASPAAGEWANGVNLLLFALRNEGRLRDAIELHRTGWLPGFPAVPQNPNDFDAGILALESGDAYAAAAVFREKARQPVAHWSPGVQARVRAWNLTLEGMSLAAAGDTSAVRALIDSVEQWGDRSAYGRDRRAHHYLRGLMFVAQHRDEDAVREFRAAIHSPNLGFTRVNYELGRALLRLGRPTEAVATLQSSLRGEIDASNLYITRTDLHELLAQAFDAAAQPDSAATHYRAVANAWKRADPVYHARRAHAEAWLAKRAGKRTG